MRKNEKSISDVMICPDCNSYYCRTYGTSKAELYSCRDGDYSVDCHCMNCGNTFTLFIRFDYSITDAYTDKDIHTD